MTNVYMAPERIAGRDYSKPCVFLAGTIDMGDSDNWQAKAAYELSDEFVVLNPRRLDWDPTWKQSMDDENFVQQVEWEQDGLDHADYILMNLLAGSKSPVSMLELGQFLDSGKLVVICPEGFYRKGNVDLVCFRYDVPVFQTLEEGIEFLKNMPDDFITDECFGLLDD